MYYKFSEISLQTCSGCCGCDNMLDTVEVIYHERKGSVVSLTVVNEATLVFLSWLFAFLQLHIKTDTGNGIRDELKFVVSFYQCFSQSECRMRTAS